MAHVTTLYGLVDILIKLSNAFDNIFLSWMLDLCDDRQTFALELDKLATEAKACTTLWDKPLGCVADTSLSAWNWQGEASLFL